MKQLAPVQFDFRKLWFHSRRKLMEVASVKEALEGIQAKWLDIAQFKYEEESEHDEELAREELELDVHIGQVKIKDLSWLQAKFEGPDLVELSLAIAEFAVPEKSWEVVEKDDHAVVTDKDRSIVFDMKHGHEVSAGVSLLIAGDTAFQPNQEALDEFEVWNEGRATTIQRAIARARNDLDRLSNPGTVLDLHRD